MNTLEIPSGFCGCGCGAKTKLAKRSRPHMGHIAGQPLPFLHGHGNAVRRLGLDRYEIADCGHDTPCWLWTGQIAQRTGYGQTRVRSRKVGAHRAMYEREVGPIPDGLELDHLCRVRVCVNPAHLEAVTRSVNVQRGYDARRAA